MLNRTERSLFKHTPFERYAFIALLAPRLHAVQVAAVYFSQLTEQELGGKLDEFQASLSGILPAPNKVTSSIGGCHFTLPQDVYALIAGADVRLYDAKHNGRAGHVLGELQAE